VKESFQRILFDRPNKVVLDTASTSTLSRDPNSVIIETEYSIISPGTELAILAGIESWAPLPFVPGYGSVGRVIWKGDSAPDFALGQRVITYGNHARYAQTSILTLPLPDGIDPMKATFARMSAVSITALRVSDAALGDAVAVFGLGLVGNLAAQLFSLSGCEVIGIDLSEKRREQARKCGISHVLAPGPQLSEKVAEITGGRMCRSVVEATGVPAVAAEAGALAGKQGELILLGSPRHDHQANLTPFLNRTHLWGNGCITLKGAHEWRFPVRDDPEGHGRFSIEGNVRILLRLIAENRLRLDPLLTHVVSPSACQSAYEGLREQKDVYTGVVFDWSK
jgi:2-desacetyl-2-hydroxyethyl bacteriochlorophyllide A dehydrogenase